MASTLPDLAVLLESWRLAMRAERKSTGTIKTYSEGVTGFLRWCDSKGHRDRPLSTARHYMRTEK
jgi:hypothetical protein